MSHPIEPSVRNVLIVGAGIGGCAAAIALAARGLNVTLIERQTRWHFPSSGIFIYHNGLRALRRLGVLDAILAAGFAIEDGRNAYLDHTGVPIVDVFYPGGVGIPPIVGIKRSMLHRVLADRLATLNIRARLGTTVTQLDSRPGGTRAQTTAHVTLSDGSTREFDLVIGADGIRSHMRGLIDPTIKPRYTGFGVWRSVHPRPAGLDLKIMMMGIGKRLGIMPISHDQLYLFGTVPEPKEHRYAPDTLAAQMRERFADFDGPARRFLDQLTEGSDVIYTAVEEIAAPLPWHDGPLLLIGDAAHASTPFMGQGGAMAIEDAVVLADMLAMPGEREAILRAFGDRRYPVCKFVQDVSRGVGEAGAVEDAASCTSRNQAMRENAQQKIDQFYHRLDALGTPVA